MKKQCILPLVESQYQATGFGVCGAFRWLYVALFLLLPGTHHWLSGSTNHLMDRTLIGVDWQGLYDVQEAPLRVGVIGLVHDHVHWILGRKDRGDIRIVGIVESNRELAKRYSKMHGYSMDLVFSSMEEMIEKVKPEAVTAFNSVYDHLKVVEFCAPRGIHVMVEKPLAVSWEHAKKMAGLARKHKIELLTNYETTWYGSNKVAFDMAVKQKDFGALRKLIFYTGHPGPIEIGCNKEFLDWLTDPVLNGGGALTDFGCYGANLSTWIMEGEKPVSITCVTQQVKPDRYPKVEDDATIIVNYPKAQAIIQASWNWSHNRKEMELYGTAGFAKCIDGQEMQIMENESKGPYRLKADPLPAERNDPFAYLAGVVRGSLEVDPGAPSSLANNLIVMQILELAKASAMKGETLYFDAYAW